MRHVTDAQRRARLAVRHRLDPAARAGGALEVARSLVAVHSTDPASVFLGVAARMAAPSVADIEHALYDERTLVRIHGMRRTLFVVPADLAPVVQVSCTDAIAAQVRRRYAAVIEGGGIAPDGEKWLRQAEEATLVALPHGEELAGAELAKRVPLLRETILVGEGKRYETRQAVTPWVLTLLASCGHIVRGRPRGSWISSQYRWMTARTWLDGRAAPPPPTLQAARAELVRCWLAAFGPGTIADLVWWTGWTATAVRQVLADVNPAEVALDGGATGLVLPGDEVPPPGEVPPAVFLPALDSTVMGWAGRDWFLGPHRATLFDRNGNAGPTVWWDGRVVGGWAQRASGDVAYRLLEDVGADAKAAVALEAERLTGWLAGVRVTPRFRTPLERTLSS
jgi:winged helix DNA-binding protein